MDVTPLVFLLVLFLGLIERGLSIKCYSCNSSPFQSGNDCAELPDKTQFEVDCDLFKKNYTKCRKVVQSVGREVTVVRQCASLGDEDGCESRAGTRDVKMKYCHCSKNLCNTASHMASSCCRFLLLTMVILAIALTTGLNNLFR